MSIWIFIYVKIYIDTSLCLTSGRRPLSRIVNPAEWQTPNASSRSGSGVTCWGVRRNRWISSGSQCLPFEVVFGRAAVYPRPLRGRNVQSVKLLGSVLRAKSWDRDLAPRAAPLLVDTINCGSVRASLGRGFIGSQGEANCRRGLASSTFVAHHRGHHIFIYAELWKSIYMHRRKSTSVERNAGDDGRHPSSLGGLRHRMHRPPGSHGCHATGRSPREGQRHGHAAKNLRAVLLRLSNTETPAGRSARSTVNAGGSENRQPARVNVHAERAHRPINSFGVAQESVALAGGKVFSQPIGGMRLYADLRGRGGGADSRTDRLSRFVRTPRCDPFY
jgi:hypothetical protein